ncbi:MAG: PA14 domain-containing protein [Verrucomicrobiales bacterium]
MTLKVALIAPTGAQGTESLQLRGTVETRDGEQLEGLISFERETMTLIGINGGAERRITAGQLKSAHMHLTGAVPQRVPGLRGTYCSTPEFGGTLIERIDAQVNFRWARDAPMPGIPPDRFSVRWEGDIETLNAGNYTFHVRSDDGARLFVDDRLLIDDWRPHPEIENSASIELEAGRRYPIRLDYFDGASLAVVSLAWTPPGGVKDLIAADRFSQAFSSENPLKERNGLRGSYFRGIYLQGSAVSRVDRSIDFPWTGRELAAGLGVHNYSVRWEGELEAPISGKVTFHTVTNDGVRLWVGGQKRIDVWKGRNATEHRAELQMVAGRRYPLKMEYFQAEGTAEARLFWSGPGLPRQVVPAEKFFVRGGVRLLSRTGTGLLLKGGSFLSGPIGEVDDKAVRISYLDGKDLRIPRQNIGGLQLSPISPERVLDVAKWKPGCALRGGDYFESSLISYHQGTLKMQSPLFGKRDFLPGKVAFVKLGDFKRSKANFELHTRSGSRLRADWLMLDGKRALVKDNSFCWINLKPGDVVAVYGIATGDGGQDG